MDKKRHISQKIENLLGAFPIVAVIGPRQCGKSTLVKSLKSDWKYYDLESPDDYQLISNDPVAFFSLNSHNIIIDEAQQYPELFKVLRGVIDQNRERKGRFILTGSSSPHIVKGITESLAGRIATVEMWPFKQTETHGKTLPDLYARLAQVSTVHDYLEMETSLTFEQSMACWLKGGFPEPVIEGESHDWFYSQWMDSYIADYVNRDIRGLFPRLNIHTFRRFLTLLAQYSGHQLNMSNMARALEVSVPTIKDYLDIIHQTFLWRNLEPFTQNPLKKVQKSKKGFFRDQGVLHHLLKINNLDQLQVHPVAGFSFESFVIEEVIRGLQSTMAAQLDYSYYRTIDQSEVDLVIETASGVIPIEVKLGSVIKLNQLRGLSSFVEDMKCSYGIVINRGKRVELITENILQIPVHFI